MRNSLEVIGFCGLFLAILTGPIKGQSGHQVDTAIAAGESPLACNLNVLDPKQRTRVHELVKELEAGAQQVNELPNGYSMRLSSDASNVSKLGEYVSLERQCCPFFDFVIQSRREDGPVWITLTGREGVKELALNEFDLQREGLSHAGIESIGAQNGDQSPLMCNDSALSTTQLGRLIRLMYEVRDGKQGVQELPDGYAVRLATDSGTVRDVAEYMSILRVCSPYFETCLEVSRQSGPVWLRMTGRRGVKELVKTELGI